MRLGLRRLSRAPHFTLLTLLVLTFAIGANITVFTVVHAVWLEPRPVRDPASLVIVMDVSPFGREDDIIGPEDLKVIRDAAMFEAVTTQKIYQVRSDASPRIHLGRTSRPVEALAVAPNYFETLGLTIWGRDFTAADDVVGAPAVGIISDRLWRTEFQRRSDVIGSLMETAGEPLTIVGVAPPGFTGALRGEQFDVWVPWAKARRLSLESVVTGLRQATAGLGIAIARLKPGVTPAEADAVVQAIPHPVSSAASYRVRPLGSVIGLPGQVTTPFGEQPVMKLIGGMAGVVLLAGCATLGILMLLHLEQRRRELAVRVTLGSGTWGLVRPVVVEAALLAAGGVVLALFAAWWSLGAAGSLSLRPGLSLDRFDLSIDRAVVGVGVLASMGAMAVAVLVPLWALSRSLTATSILQSAAATPTRSSVRLRRNLLSAHVAATLVVVIGGALFVRTIGHAFSEGPGFDAGRTVFVSVKPSSVQYYDPVTNEGWNDRELEMEAYSRFMDELRSLPHVQKVAVGDAPIRHGESGGSFTSATPVVGSFRLEGRSLQLQLGVHWAYAGYREALGLPLLSGRDPIDDGEVLITRSLAARLWPDGDALGQPLRRNYNERVVGIVPDFVQGSLANDAAGGVIFHHAGQPNRMAVTQGVHVVVGTRSNAGPTVAAIEEMVARHFPNAMRSRVASGRQLVETDMTRQRLGATFFGGFGLVSTALGGVAVFGLVGHLVRSRARELGVRLALGATPNHLMASTVRTGLWPVCFGTAVGLLVAVALSGVIRAYIHGISPLDPVSYLGAAALLVVSAAAAGLLAARRIRRIAPMDALRAE